LERQIIERAELLFDQHEDLEEKESPSEDFAALHFQRIQAIPVLTDAEEADLLQLWCEFKDEKARERIIEAHMRMVPPIARNAAYKAGFQPNYNMMAGTAKWTAGVGFDEVISDLTAAGNLGLMLAVDGYRLGKDVKFYTYARTCVQREIWKQATFLRSAVRRKDGSSAIMDLSIDPLLPDVRDARDDNVGSRAKPSVSDDPEDDPGDAPNASHSHLRPQPQAPIELNLDALPEADRLLLRARMRGIKLNRIAEALGVSVATVWRREQAAIKRIKPNGNFDC
jgi:RNA polymerase sigma factor (sigma-70 family)